MTRTALRVAALIVALTAIAHGDGGTLTPGGMTRVNHDATLTGNGTAASALAVTTPVAADTLTGTVTSGDLLVATGLHTAGNYAGSDPGACAAGSADTHPALSATGALTKSCLVFVNAAGAGLSLSSSTLSIDPAYTQRRVTGTCSDPFSPTAINQDGTVVCSTTTASMATGTTNRVLKRTGTRTIGDTEFPIDDAAAALTLGNATTDTTTVNGKLVVNVASGGQVLQVTGVANGLSDGIVKVQSNKTAWGTITGQLTTTAGGSTSTDKLTIAVDSGSLNFSTGGLTDALVLAHAGGGQFAGTLGVTGAATLSSTASVAGASNSNSLSVTHSQTAQTANVHTVDSVMSGTYDTTSGPLFPMAVSGTCSATRSAGAGALNCIALYGNASGATNPYALYTDNGDVKLNVSGGAFTAMAGMSANSQKITSLANGTASTDAAAFGQIQTGIAADFTGTTNYLPKRTGATTYADSAVIDDSATGEWLFSRNGTVTTFSNTTNSVTGWGVNAPDNVYIDTKTLAGDKTIFRSGAGAEAAATRNWLLVTNATGATELVASATLDSTLNVAENALVATANDCSRLNVGRDTGASTNAQNGFSITPCSDGNNYVDSKTITSGSTIFRFGAGAQTGANDTWLTLNNTTGATTFAKAGTFNSTLLLNGAGASYEAINTALDSNVGLKITKPTGATYGFYVASGAGYFAETLAVVGAQTNSSTITDNTAVGATFGTNFNLDLTDTTSEAAGVGAQIKLEGAYTGTSNTTAAMIKAMKANGIDGDFGFGLAFGTRVNGGGVSRDLFIDQYGVTSMLVQGLAVGGLYEGQVQDIADTFQSGKIRKNWAINTDQMATTWIVNNYASGSTLVYATSSGAINSPWYPSTQTPAASNTKSGKLTCSDGTTTCANGGSDYRITLTSTQSGVSSLQSTTVTFSVWLQMASGTNAAAKIGLGRYNDNEQTFTTCPTVTATGWTRCSTTKTFSATSYTDNSEFRAYIQPRIATTSMYIAGAQIELGSVPTPYQPNDGTTNFMTASTTDQGAWAVQLGVGNTQPDPVTYITASTAYFGTTVNVLNDVSLTASNNGDIEYLTTTNATAQGSINYNGYNGGTTQFRDLVIYDGKRNAVLGIYGSTSPYKLDFNGDDVRFGGTHDGGVYLTNEGLNFGYDENVGLTANINGFGYQGGTTQFRSLNVNDGKGNIIATFKGQASPALDMASHPIQSVTDPSNAQDAATKNYVDTKGGLLIGRQILTAASGTYTPTTGTKKALVQMCGGGGGGGGAKGAASAAGVGGGGSAGAYFEKYIDCAGSCNGGAYANGAAGTAGTSTPGAGGAGGDTTLVVVTGTTLTAKGGSGGSTSSTGVTSGIANGGISQSGSSAGDRVSQSMELGNPGVILSATIVYSGKGGSSIMGAGGTGQSTAAAGAAGTGNCSGGGGGNSQSATGQAGGAGTIGIIVIDEFR